MTEPDQDGHIHGSTVRAGIRILAMGVRLRPLQFAAAAAGGLLYGGMTVAGAEVLGQVTDRVIFPAFVAGSATTGALVAAAAAIMGVALAKAIGIVGRRVGGSWMQLSLHAESRRRITSRYLSLPVEWHASRQTGSLLSTANADVEATWSPIAPLPMTFGVAFMLLITGVALVLTDPFLAVIGFTVGPAIGLLNWRYTRVFRGPARVAQAGRARVSAIAHESFDGATVVKTLGLETAEAGRFATASDGLRDDLVRLGRIRAVFDPLLDMLPQVGILLVVYVGARRAAAGAVTAGEVIEFAYLFSLLALPLRIIGYLLAELPRSVVGWERIREVLEATDVVSFGDGPLEGRGRAAAVHLDRVSYTHPGGDSTAVDDLSLQLDPGAVVAVVGATGSGKSTLAALMLRLVDPDAGVVRVDGRDLRSLPEGDLAGHVALVFQEPFIFDDTVRGNVALDDRDQAEGGTTDAAVWDALALAQADGFVRLLPEGLSTQLGERGTTLSGGQRQRIALARALVRRPRLLVLDDATSAIDVAVEADILRGLRDASLDATVVIMAHRRATIELADEVIHVEAGRVVARGSHAELMASEPSYADLLSAYEVAP